MTKADISKPVYTQRVGAALVVTNNRPEERNPISAELFGQVMAAITAASSDPEIAAIILTGAGGFFCAGGNLNDLAASRDLTPEQRRARLEILHDCTRAVVASPTPVIAAVEGGAAGAGCSIALACDFVVAARDAQFLVAYVNVGLTPDGGVTSFLADIMPRQMAQEMCLLGTPQTAERFQQFGAVNVVSDPGEALQDALALADRLARGPRQTIATIKGLCAAAPGNTLADQLELEAVAMVNAQCGEDAKEGIAAFFGKRRPAFNTH